MLVRPPPTRWPREPGIHLSEAGRAAPSPFSPGTLKAHSPAGSTIWAAALLGFLCCLLNVLLSCKPISPFRLPGRAVGALGAPLTSGNARAPSAALPGPEGSRTPGGVDASLPGFGPQSLFSCTRKDKNLPFDGFIL
ncbi:unnamed protein product [Rangifer tarandus platyrhynchus]|uniref:Uncharacterized protein n=2 Tax=Rangifer tarandus platyrhynchus TaxID=3082113 RepID=A0ABN8ZR91_RANTA|nr:unnamed protein product [Rangifer tarandus platyrhynchus]